MRRAAQPLTWRSDVKKFAKGDLAAPKSDRGRVKRVTDVTMEGIFIKVEGIDPNSLNRPASPEAAAPAPTSPSDAPAPLTAPTPQVRNPFTGDAPAAPAPSNP